MIQKNKRDGIVYYRTFPPKNLLAEQQISRELLKKGFMDFFGRELDEGAIKIGRHGKPYYEGCDFMQFNISHCKTGAAAAVSNVPVGIDVESMRKVHGRTAVKGCTSRECSYIFGSTVCGKEPQTVLSGEQTVRFLKLWTLKESYVKMTGEGLFHAPQEIDFDLTEVSEKEMEPLFLPEMEDALSCLYLTKQLFMALTVLKKENCGMMNFEWKTYDLSGKINI